jgi:hypothetical protein
MIEKARGRAGPRGGGAALLRDLEHGIGSGCRPKRDPRPPRVVGDYGMKIHRVLTLVALLAHVAAAQPKDVLGWGKTKWGMTQKQVRDVYPEAVAAEEGRLKISSIRIADGDASVLLGFKNRRLSVVAIFPVAGQNWRKRADEIRAALIDKYGQPRRMERPSEIQAPITAWSFPSTRIELRALGMGDAAIITVTYTPPTSEEDRNL